MVVVEVGVEVNGWQWRQGRGISTELTIIKIKSEPHIRIHIEKRSCSFVVLSQLRCFIGVK